MDDRDFVEMTDKALFVLSVLAAVVVLVVASMVIICVTNTAQTNKSRRNIINMFSNSNT